MSRGRVCSLFYDTIWFARGTWADGRAGADVRAAGRAGDDFFQGRICQAMLVSWPREARGAPAFAGIGDFSGCNTGIVGEFVRDAEVRLSNLPRLPS